MKNQSSEAERIKNDKLLEDILSFEGGKLSITGLGISGKSTFRRSLFQYLKNAGRNVEHYDADNFKILRHPLDKSCLKEIPEKFGENIIYLIEDVHAPIKDKAVLPIQDYNKILYINPDFSSYSKFWFQRMFTWYENGNFSWDPNKGWSGTGKKRDPENIEGIVNAFLKDIKNREKWLEEDFNVIKDCPHEIIKSVWTKEGPVFY